MKSKCCPRPDPYNAQSAPQLEIRLRSLPKRGSMDDGALRTVTRCSSPFKGEARRGMGSRFTSLVLRLTFSERIALQAREIKLGPLELRPLAISFGADPQQLAVIVLRFVLIMSVLCGLRGTVKSVEAVRDRTQ